MNLILFAKFTSIPNTISFTKTNLTFTFCSFNSQMLHIITNSYLDAYNIAIMFLTSTDSRKKLASQKNIIINAPKECEINLLNNEENYLM